MRTKINLLIAASILLFSGCKKDQQWPWIVTSQPTVAKPAPVVNAGTDTLIEIPQNYVDLTASVTDGNGIIKSKWEKISGPASAYIGGANNLSARVHWLEEGIYEFEITVTDDIGLSDKDTVKVILGTQLRKYTVNNLTADSNWITETQLPEEVFRTIKWVFCKSPALCEQADDGPQQDIDYSWGGWYYTRVSTNKILVFGGYSNENFDLIIYY